MYFDLLNDKQALMDTIVQNTPQAREASGRLYLLLKDSYEWMQNLMHQRIDDVKTEKINPQEPEKIIEKYCGLIRNAEKDYKNLTPASAKILFADIVRRCAEGEYLMARNTPGLDNSYLSWRKRGDFQPSFITHLQENAGKDTSTITVPLRYIFFGYERQEMRQAMIKQGERSHLTSVFDEAVNGYLDQPPTIDDLIKACAWGYMPVEEFDRKNKIYTYNIPLTAEDWKTIHQQIEQKPLSKQAQDVWDEWERKEQVPEPKLVTEAQRTSSDDSTRGSLPGSPTGSNSMMMPRTDSGTSVGDNDLERIKRSPKMQAMMREMGQELLNQLESGEKETSSSVVSKHPGSLDNATAIKQKKKHCVIL